MWDVPDQILENPALSNILSNLQLWDGKWPHVPFECVDLEIQTAEYSYVTSGYYLARMKYYKLYKPLYKNFSDYCRRVLKKTAHYCNQIIKAAQVCVELAANFKQLPACVAQAIPLVKFAKVDECGDSLLANKWQEVLAATADDGAITAQQIKQIVTGDEPEEAAKPVRIRVRGNLSQKLKEKAASLGMSPEQLAEQILGEYLGDEEAAPEPPELLPEVKHTAEQLQVLDELDEAIAQTEAKKAMTEGRPEAIATLKLTVSDSNGTSHHAIAIPPAISPEPEPIEFEVGDRVQVSDKFSTVQKLAGQTGRVVKILCDKYKVRFDQPVKNFGKEIKT